MHKGQHHKDLTVKTSGDELLKQIDSVFNDKKIRFCGQKTFPAIKNLFRRSSW